MPWDPNAIIGGTWGRLQIVFDGVDVTYFRDVPTTVLTTDFNEPFGDGPARIQFPQITSFEALPDWLNDFANVEINQVHPDGSVTNLWEGIYVSQADDIDGGSVIDCVGALYQADLFKKPPSFDLDARDIGRLIPELLNDRIAHYGLRLNTITPFDTGLFALNRGSWQPMLSGYIQDILSTASLITDLGTGQAVGIAVKPDGSGYWVTGSQGHVLPFGERTGYYGSRARLALNEPISGAAATPSGNGYWLAAEDGGVFAYGDAGFYGSLPPILDPNTVVEIEPTPSGHGYWLVAKDGGVFAFGDAPFEGSGVGLSIYPFVDITSTPSGGGYWLMDRMGRVYAFGDASYAGNASPSVDDDPPTPDSADFGVITPGNLDIHWRPIVYNEDGSISTVRSITITIDSDHGVVLPTVSPQATIWTNAEAIAHYKETDEHLGVFDTEAHANAYAEALHEQQAIEYAPNRIWVAIENITDSGYWLLNSLGKVEIHGVMMPTYGGMDGIPLNKPMVDMVSMADKHGYWLVAGDGGVFAFNVPFWGAVPEYNGVSNQYTLTKVAPRTPVLRLKDKTTIHWTITTGTPGIKHSLQRDLTMAPNCIYGEGIAPDGCHWRNTRYPSVETIDTAIFLPLACQPAVEPYIYKADGVIASGNPSWDPQRVRVDHYENMGDQLTLMEGIHSARAEIVRDMEPGWLGTINMAVDPEEGSRLSIRDGQNILLKAHRGADRLLHISKVHIDWKTLRVEVTVDEKARDMATIAGILTADRELNDPTKRLKPTKRSSRQVEDRVAVFDCEAGAGVLPPIVIPALIPTHSDNWVVVRIPFAERGTIMKSFIHTYPAIEFAMAIFDKPWTKASIVAKMPDGPFSYDADGKNPWDSWTGADDPIMAWGGVEQPAGYSPELKNPDGEITGDLIDTSSWYYESKAPPWLWVALYHEESFAVTFTGLFTPGILAAN